jgi:hypothetical protein
MAARAPLAPGTHDLGGAILARVVVDDRAATPVERSP